MIIEFPYRRESSERLEYIYRPVAKVFIKGSNQRDVFEYFYVDSGADYTLIPYKLGRFLGFSAENREVNEVQGISGAVGIVLTEMKMRIGECEFTAPVGWAQIEHVPMLLGRSGVFDQFEVIFRQSEHKVIFQK